MDSEEYRKKLERDILDVIEQKLQNGQMDADRARAIARMVLDRLHPPPTLEQIFEIAPTLDDEFRELSTAILPILSDHDDKMASIVSGHIESLMKSGKVDAAYEVIKGPDGGLVK